MKYKVVVEKEVSKDIKKLRLSKDQIIALYQKIKRISENPHSKVDGGYGEPLKGPLKGLLKFRFDHDYRVVYQLKMSNEEMQVIIVGLRKDKKVYKETLKRLNKNIDIIK